ncbi:hypothetical protein PIB30_007034 [Stylosanthes scabra]|uniref:Uncharacterized protein n=1 Tax=Stylosanthes scabra TaxID=79078 RepID=A0ABU6Q4E3_9FABA|nr:hypothetical protein [Stylosanthes scabra]
MVHRALKCKTGKKKKEALKWSKAICTVLFSFLVNKGPKARRVVVGFDIWYAGNILPLIGPAGRTQNRTPNQFEQKDKNPNHTSSVTLRLTHSLVSSLCAMAPLSRRLRYVWVVPGPLLVSSPPRRASLCVAAAPVYACALPSLPSAVRIAPVSSPRLGLSHRPKPARPARLARQKGGPG